MACIADHAPSAARPAAAAGAGGGGAATTVTKQDLYAGTSQFGYYSC